MWTILPGLQPLDCTMDSRPASRLEAVRPVTSAARCANSSATGGGQFITSRRSLLAYRNGANLFFIPRISRFREVIGQLRNGNTFALTRRIVNRCRWACAVPDLCNRRRNGKNTRRQNFGSQERVNEGTLAPLHLPQHSEMKTIGSEFSLQRKQLLADVVFPGS